MSTYLIILLLATFLGLIGLGLMLLPIRKKTPKVTDWYKKITRSKTAPTVPSHRSEPRFRSKRLKGVESAHNTRAPLFKEETVDHHLFSILYLIAPPHQYYAGYVLWQALTSQKLKYGPMKVFHFHEADHTMGKILFSVANALEPGYFANEQIEDIKTPGLCLFMHNHSISDPVKTYDIMLKTAKRLEHLLGGTLCDHQRQPLSDATIQKHRTQVATMLKEG